MTNAARMILTLTLASAGVVFSGEKSDWPLIVVRHTSAVNQTPDILEKIIAIHEKYPGSADEFWFCTNGRKTPESLRAQAKAFARHRAACERAGIRVSYQEGLTLGHGVNHDGKPQKPDDYPFPPDAWQKDRNGRHLGFLCPRAPAVLDYEYQYTKAILETVNPWSFWIDDDLRLGACKTEGCFCDRCIAAFNAKEGLSLTREQLVAHVFSKETLDEIRGKWCTFNGESLACYGAAARRAADELKSPCRLAYQAVWSDTVYTARDYRPLLEALSGPRRIPTGIRPGACYYTEDRPREMTEKALSVAREAERCRSYGCVGTVCYEQETYPRHILHKSPEAIAIESALAIASGTDTVSLYWYAGDAPEPMEDYERFARTIAAWRSYFEALSASTRRTRLGGVARYLGSRAIDHCDFDLRDDADRAMALAGIPVTVAEGRPVAWYVTAKSRACSTPQELAAIKSRTVPVPQKFPLARERTALLDALDRVTNGAFPVRVENCHPFRILPRVDEAGRTDSVTLLNCSIGESDAIVIKVRNPRGRTAYWHRPKGRTRVDGTFDAARNEFVCTLPALPGWQPGTLFFE